MIARWVLCLVLSVLALALVPGMALSQTSEKRVALVIGNSAYQGDLPQLRNPFADARDIGRALEAVGFAVTVKTDVKRRELYQLINGFAGQIAGSPDTVGLFYYAGHGIQANGKNYLVPVDAALTSESDLEAEAVEADRVLQAMEQAHNRINIVILDACRDNPLPKSRSLARGLTTISAPRGTFIGYAAAPGQSALDGEPGENGVFTGVLLKQLAVPGQQLETVFKRVIAGVAERTAGKQLPWMHSSVQGEFFFVPPGTAAPVLPPPPTPAPPSPSGVSPSEASEAEIVFWQSIQQSQTVADYEEYLKQFSQGRFAGLARLRIASLKSPPADQKPPPSPDSGAEEELALWKNAMSGGSSAGYEEYLRRYPRGRFADIARHQLAVLRPLPSPPKAPPPEVSKRANLCGRPTDYVLDTSGSGRWDGFIGAWTGNWNNASGICGALVVSKLYPDGRAEIIYIYGPGSGFGRGLAWKRQQLDGTISGGTLSFRDDQGGMFSFDLVNRGSLQAAFSSASGRLRAILAKSIDAATSQAAGTWMFSCSRKNANALLGAAPGAKKIAIVAAVSLAALCCWRAAAAQEAALLACPTFTAEPVLPAATRNDPNTRRRLAEISADLKSKPHTVLFLGDSITQRWPSQIWQQSFAPLGSVNAGIDGERTDHLLTRIQQWRFAGDPPAAIVLLIGTNDLGHGRTPDVAAEGVRANLLYLRQRFPRARILLLGLLPRWDRFGQDIPAVNQFLRQCGGGAVSYTDIGSGLLDQGSLSRATSPDGVHFSETGYQRLAQALKPLIESALVVPGNTTPLASATAPIDAERVFWQSIPPNAGPADYAEYLRQYPQGLFAPDARKRLAALTSPAESSAAAAAMPPPPATSSPRIEAPPVQSERPGPVAAPQAAPPPLPKPPPTTPEELVARGKQEANRRDYKKAALYFGEAARKGNEEAMLHMARSYRDGRGVALDIKAAMRNYTQAAGKGNSQAMIELAELYESGKRVPKDHVAAVSWYKKSAESGNQDAQDWLKKHGE